EVEELVSRGQKKNKGAQDHEQLSIATNTRIDPGPRVGVFANVVGYSHPVASAKLARCATDASPPGHPRCSHTSQQLLHPVYIQSSPAERLTAIQQLRGVCHG